MTHIPAIINRLVLYRLLVLFVGLMLCYMAHFGTSMTSERAKELWVMISRYRATTQSGSGHRWRKHYHWSHLWTSTGAHSKLSYSGDDEWMDFHPTSQRYYIRRTSFTVKLNQWTSTLTGSINIYADEQQSILWAHTVQRYMLHLYDAHFLLMKSKNILLLVTFVSNLVETDF